MSVVPELAISPQGEKASAAPTTGLDQSKTLSPSKSVSLLECDYDVNPTYLYQAIEASQWGHCKTILVNSADRHDQTCTWVVRKEPDGKLRWRLLPVHAAVIFKAPLDILELLLQEYPAGAQQKDDQGMLPLHLSFRNDASWDVVEELLTAYPNGIHTKDRKGRTPLQCATSDQMKKPASVLELYTQIALGSERQRTLQESRTLMESRIGALQETHVTTLTRLKQEWQQQQEHLQIELDATKEAVRESQRQLTECREELAVKAAMEEELTVKLTEVTTALQLVTESQQSKSLLESTKSTQRERNLTNMVQTLMSQQLVLKGRLQQETLRSSDSLEKQKKLFEQLVEIQTAKQKETHKENEAMKKLVDETHSQAELMLAKWDDINPSTIKPESTSDIASLAEEESVQPGTDLPHAGTGTSTPSLLHAGPISSSVKDDPDE